jgi:hypothetical protein
MRVGGWATGCQTSDGLSRQRGRTGATLGAGTKGRGGRGAGEVRGQETRPVVFRRLSFSFAPLLRNL